MTSANPVALDKSGCPIAVGNLIIYGHAMGRCAGLRYGKVLAITWHEQEEYNYALKVWGKQMVPHFKVQGVDDDWTHKGVELNKKKGTLMFGTRILVVNRSQVPDLTLALLDTVPV